MSTFQLEKLSNNKHKHCCKLFCLLNIDVTLLLRNMEGKKFCLPLLKQDSHTCL